MKNRNIIIHITIICLCVALLTLLCACKNNTSEKVTEGTESGNKETQNEKSDDKDSGRMYSSDCVRSPTERICRLYMISQL